MILNDKQLATQEAILKRLYPWVSMDEANEKELELCRGLVYNITILYSTMQHMPPTLSRVIKALNSPQNWHIETHLYKDWICSIFTDRSNNELCKRKLLNEDMTECSLRDQSIETQDIIYNILCKD